jgi:queuine tRNA-ribosyltransferase
MGPDPISLMSSSFSFILLAQYGAARQGEIRTVRGNIHTPAFMPVGTAATVKAMLPLHVRETGADILLGNTYHLMLRPGAERVARLGGLHHFMNWPHPILTDSGGFQVMSLANLRKITEEGVTFRSHIDGSVHHLTPERAVEIQTLLGSDIQMQLDECVRLPAEQEAVQKAMHLSLRWAERAKKTFGNPIDRALFGIVQGGDVPSLRRQSASELAAMDLKGYAIGGLAVGEPQQVMLEMIEATEPSLPAHKPRYLMGVGTPDDLMEAVRRGIDMFDCVMPTRAGRHGLAFTREGRINLRNACHAEDQRPLDETASCPATRDYSRAYLHHLTRANELLGMTLLTWNNLSYYQDLMSGLRRAIHEKRLEDFIGETREGWARGAREKVSHE